MRKVLAFLVWLFSFWTWKEFFLCRGKRISHPSNGETAGTEQLPSQEGQPESEFARFLSFLAEDEHWCTSLNISGGRRVRINFAPQSTEFMADVHTGYSEFLSAVSSSKVGIRESFSIKLNGDDSCIHMEEFVDALRQSGTDLRKLDLSCWGGSAIRFAKCISSVLPRIHGIQDLALSFDNLGEVMGKEVAAEFMANIALPDILRILKSFETRLTKLDGEGMEQLIKPLMGLHSVVEVFRCDPVTSDVQLEHISGMLATSTSLKTLYLWRDGGGALTPLTRGFTKIAAALCSNQSLKTLECGISSNMELKALLDPLMPHNNNLQRNISLTELVLWGEMGGKEGIETLVDMLRTNTSLLHLILRPRMYSGDPEAIENVLAILEALKVNKSLKSIDFRMSKVVGGYQVLGAMMDMLLENHCIEHIRLESTGLDDSGDAEYVYSALSRRRKMKLWDIVQGMANVNPTSGRVFLCGHPYAGKTRLRMSMKQLIKFQEKDESQTKSRIGKKLRIPFKRPQVPKVQKADLLLERTRGIEVDNVTFDGINMTIWDMAGQTDYHSFHELVMPNLSADGSCSMFLLLCNPMVGHLNPSEGRNPSNIRFELRAWLRFIASNTRRSLSYRPHVSIIMTHFDYWKDDHAFIARIEDVVKDLKSLFQKELEFDEDKVIFKVDGTDVSQVCGVFDFIKSHLNQLLQRLPKTIGACQEVQDRIALWNADKSKPQLLKWNDFCDNMCKDVDELNDMDLELAKKRREFVAISLNDRGLIIYDDKEGNVITNPHWFCHDIIGQFLNQCATKGRKLEMVSSNGFISIDHTKRFMMNLIEGQGDIEKKYDDILNMMKKLHICYEQDANFIMIPSTLKDEVQNLSWLKEDGSTSSSTFTHVGRRLACKDGKKTMLTPGFFTRIQVSFFNKLQQTNGLNSFKLFQNVIKFIKDGIEVILEFNHGDIDIFLRSNQCQDKMLEFLENGIIRHIKHLQVDPTLGCPGVLLEEYILRPACVQKLLNSKVRKNQYVHMKELEVAVIKCSVDAIHIWNLCEGLDVGFNDVKSLLGSLAWKNLLERRSQDLQKYNKKIQSLSTLTQNDSFTCNEEKNNISTSLWDIPQRLLYKPLNLKLDIMMEENRKHHKDVMLKLDNIMQVIQNLENGIKKMEGELLHQVCSRIDELMAFSLEMQKSQIPRLAYLCEIGKRELLTRLVPGLDKFQLHLMCENIHGFHEVVDQKGCVVTFGTKDTRRFLAMLEWGLTIATILTKIGAHVTCAMGSMVPDFSDSVSFAALILDTPSLLDCQIPKATLESLPDDVRKVSKISVDDRSEAQRWLRGFIEEKFKNRRELYNEFKLKKVRYRGASGPIAWICDECITKHNHEIDVLF